MKAIQRPPPLPKISTPGGWIRRKLSRFLIYAAIVSVLLVTIFYAVENWRGRRAWERCQQELTANGEKLDWEAFIPPPVPDDENFFESPGMTAWFSKKAWQTNAHLPILSLPSWVTNPPLTLDQLRTLPERVTNRMDLATAVLPGVSNDVIPLIMMEEVPIRAAIEALARQAGLETVLDDRSSWPTNVSTEVTFRVKDSTARAALADILRQRGLTARWDAETKLVRIGLVGSREDLREWFAGHETEYAMITAACKRPRARLAETYNDPINLDFPNYVNIRAVVYALATHANLNLLNGQPAAAAYDLRLMRRLAVATSDDPTLVGPMISAAIIGQYADAVREGMDAGLWPDAQLQEIQSQTSGINLLDDVVHSLRAERAGKVHVLGRPLAEFTGQNSTHRSKLGIWVISLLWPHGWSLQNQATLCRLYQNDIEPCDAQSRRIYASRYVEANSRVEAAARRARPYSFFALLFKPNFARAVEAAGRRQTQLDQIRVACALERHRIAHGNFPERLEALVPVLLDNVPNDIFSGKSLQYRRNDDGSYRLWSVGWNEKDDGGDQTLDADGKPVYDVIKGDWVWRSPAK